MFSKRHILILFLITVILASVSQVSAEDLNSTDAEMTIGNGEIALDESDFKTFSDLNTIINGNSDKNVYLNDDFRFNSSSDSKFEQGINVTRQVTVHGNNHVIDADNQARIFIASNKKIVFRDITFTNGHVRYEGNHINGGAIYGDFTCINCTFTKNSAVNAGAVHGGTVINCTFNDNYAYYWGGAMYYGSVYNCTFIDNSADYGGALWYCFSCENSVFINNFASLDGGAVNTAPVRNCTFINNYAKYGGALYMKGVYDIFECLDSDFINNSAVLGGSIYYDKDISDNADSKFSAVNCSFTGNHADNGGALYNSNGFDSMFADNSASESGGAMYRGMAKRSVFTNNSADNGGALYNGVSVDNAFDANSAYSGNDTSGTAFKSGVIITASKVETVYNVGKNLIVKLMDSKGNALSKKTVYVNLNGKTYKEVTDAGGQARISSYNLAPKTYTAAVTFNGDDNYVKECVKAKVVVKKATPKLTAKAKTFRLKDSAKKFTATLKNNKNKAMKNVKITLKVNGKTYSAKTNSKGQAVFKLSRLAKKGTFKATVKYAGSKCYNAKSVEAKISVKK